jgi:putative membrane protein insertion efficiency factor
VPSCSDYARDAIIEHGLLKGSWLAARRLSRCHPLGSSGLDPVPRRATPGRDARRRDTRRRDIRRRDIRRRDIRRMKGLFQS